MTVLTIFIFYENDVRRLQISHENRKLLSKQLWESDV